MVNDCIHYSTYSEIQNDPYDWMTKMFQPIKLLFLEFERKKNQTNKAWLLNYTY